MDTNKREEAIRMYASFLENGATREFAVNQAILFGYEEGLRHRLDEVLEKLSDMGLHDEAEDIQYHFHPELNSPKRKALVALDEVETRLEVLYSPEIELIRQALESMPD